MQFGPAVRFDGFHGQIYRRHDLSVRKFWVFTTKTSMRHSPGRDASDGRPHVGQCEYRPAWLDFDSPKPVEWLVLMAALEDNAPWWMPLSRPLP